ncbi:MAG TPA: surface-adhesin E family protein [Smithella sp.]|nr:surface-adhesin E family protein [Smithella sp.]
MRFKSFWIFLIVMVFSFPALSFAGEPDSKVWEAFDNDWYFNKTNMIKSNYIVSVWVYKDVGVEGRKEKIEAIKKTDPDKAAKYQKYDHYLSLWEVDLNNKQRKLKEVADYDDRGNVIESNVYRDREWKDIKPNSIFEKLYNKVSAIQNIKPSKEVLDREQEAKDRKIKEQQEKERLAKEELLKEKQAKEELAREEREKEQKAREQKIKEQQMKEQQAREERARIQQEKEDKAREQRAREDEERARVQQEKEDKAREQRAREDEAREERAKERRFREERAKETPVREAPMRETAMRDTAEEESSAISGKPFGKGWEALTNNVYYNNKTIRKTAKAISVWTYNIVTDDFREKKIASIRKTDPEKARQYEYYDHNVVLSEINCKKKLAKTNMYVDYDDAGEELHSYTYTKREWEVIKPGSLGEKLYHQLCAAGKAPLSKKKALKKKKSKKHSSRKKVQDEGEDN